jgi:CHAT domain-containing protein
LWPISDQSTVIYVDLFYELFARQLPSVNIAEIILECSSKMREMSKGEAVKRIRNIRSKIRDEWASMRLEGYEAQLTAAEECPFWHPFDWASFHIAGSGFVSFNQKQKYD